MTDLHYTEVVPHIYTASIVHMRKSMFNTNPTKNLFFSPIYFETRKDVKLEEIDKLRNKYNIKKNYHIHIGSVLLTKFSKNMTPYGIVLDLYP
jgi:hypothetical protein